MSTDQKALFSRQAGTWFKGLAIVMVVLSHFAEWWSWFQETEGTAEIFRQAFLRMGPYGVAIFLLFSGYGISKSAGTGRIGSRFLLRRITAVYIPYVIVVLVIEMLSDGLHTWKDMADILNGHDFWYMTVLFLFYIAFMVIGHIFVNKHLRAIGIVLFTIIMSMRLYGMERQEFWYVSNPAFALGVLLAIYEPLVLKIPDKVKGLITMILAGVSGYAIYSGLFMEHIWEMPVDKIYAEMWAVFGFTLLVASLAAKLKKCDVVMQFLGKYSLYIYLLHTFLFMWIINHTSYPVPVQFFLAAAAIVAVSVGMGFFISLGMKKLNQRIDKKFAHRE